MSDFRWQDNSWQLYHYTCYGYDNFKRLAFVSEFDTSLMPTLSQISAKKVCYSYDTKDNLIQITYPENDSGVRALHWSALKK